MWIGLVTGCFWIELRDTGFRQGEMVRLLAVLQEGGENFPPETLAQAIDFEVTRLSGRHRGLHHKGGVPPEKNRGSSVSHIRPAINRRRGDRSSSHSFRIGPGNPGRPDHPYRAKRTGGPPAASPRPGWLGRGGESSGTGLFVWWADEGRWGGGLVHLSFFRPWEVGSQLETWHPSLEPGSVGTLEGVVALHISGRGLEYAEALVLMSIPGSRRGCSPTTPSPLTSCSSPVES